MTTAVVLGSILVLAILLHYVWRALDRSKEETAAALVADMAGLGEIIPPSLYPLIDPHKCIGSGACIRACPEHDIIAMVGGQAKLINALGCVGHGECADACAFDAIALVFGTETRGLELPKIDKNYQTNQPGVYIVGELGGMGLIRNAVRQGDDAAKHVAGEARRGINGALDAIVVGAGPAGIAATLGLLDAGLRVELLDREDFGGTILHYPRAKVVMTGAIEFPKYGAVKKRTMSKEALVELWDDIRSKVDIPFTAGELVESLTHDADDMWRVTSTKGERRAANVVLALGRRGSPNKIGCPGEELSKVAYRLLEPEVFKGQHVLVVGGGNSAVESAIGLAEQGGCASVAISYRRTEFARCRHENKQRIAALIASGKVSPLMPTTVTHIGERDVSVRFEDGREQVFANDAVIAQIGGTSPAVLLQSFGIRMVVKRAER